MISSSIRCCVSYLLANGSLRTSFTPFSSLEPPYCGIIEVMVTDKDDNEQIRHNEPITGRPPILIPATGQANDGLIIQMGATGPQVLDFGDEGAPGRVYADWGMEPFQTVKEFTSAYIHQGSIEHSELETDIVDKDWKTLKLGLVSLRYSHETFPKDIKEAKRELSKASQRLFTDPRLQATFAGGQLPQVTAWFYPAFFNRELKRTRLVLWLTKDNQFIPAIFCPSMKTALFAFAVFHGVAACTNCGELFTLDSERADNSRGEKYCTAACGQRYRQKVYRLKVKATTKSAKGEKLKANRRRK
jgi:hypothetical protein